MVASDYASLEKKSDNKNIERKIREINENLCWVPFLRKAERIAIIKSSLFAIILS